MRYISHIPLIGGFTIGAINATNNYPLAITSYIPFEFNDNLLNRYLKEVKNKNIPYIHLNNTEHEFNLNEYKNIDFVHSTPPCSGLSQYASREKGSRGTAEPNEWMYKSLEFYLDKVKPTVFIFENAPGLYTNIGEPVRNRCIEICKKHNYAITFYKTNTLYHGIPQNRPRTYVICLKGDKAPILEYFNKPRKNISEYLKEIPNKSSLQNQYFNDDWDVSNYEVIKYIKENIGHDWRKILLEQRDHIGIYEYLRKTNKLKSYRDWLIKKYPNNEKTIKVLNHIIKKTDMGKNYRVSYKAGYVDKEYVYAITSSMMDCAIHPIENRLYNIREHLYFMGMPNDFELYNNKEYPKLTQNCPVSTNEDMIKEVMAIINGERQLSNNRVLMQDNTNKKEEVKTKNLF